MKYFLALLILFIPSLAFTQGYINAPIYAPGVVQEIGTGTITTQLKQAYNPGNITVFAMNPITTWTVVLPSPAFDGQTVSIGCPYGTITTLTVTSQTDQIGPNNPSACLQGQAQISFIFKSGMWISGGAATVSINPSMSSAQITSYISAAVASKFAGVRFSPGTYSLTPTSTGSDGSSVDILITSANNFTVDCGGSLLQQTGADKPSYGHGFRIENSTNITFRNCLYDYVKLPYVQTIATTIGASSITFTINPDFVAENGIPAWLGVQRVSRYDPVTKLWLFQDLEAPNNRAVTIAGNQITVDYTNDLAAKANVVVGGYYLLENQVYGPSDGTGHTTNFLSLSNVNGLTLDNTIVYTDAGQAFQGMNASNVTFTRSGCRIKPGTIRIQSVSADCVNIVHTRGPFTFDAGWVEGPQDDGINVYSDMAPIIGINNTTTVLAGPTAGGLGLTTGSWAVGDIVEFLDSTGKLLGTATLLANSNGVLTFTSPIPSGINNSTCNTTTLICTISDRNDSSSNYTVTRSQLNRMRGRALTGNAQEYTILGNTFSNLQSNGAIAFNSTYSYFAQGPVPQNGTISDNRFDRINSIGFDPAVITLYRFSSAGSNFALANGSIGGGNWTIEGNHFTDTKSMALLATSLDGIHLADNTCTRYASSYDTNSGFPFYQLGSSCIGLVNVTNGRVDATNQYLPPSDLLRAAAVPAPDSLGNAGATQVVFNTANKLVGVLTGAATTQVIPSDVTDFIISASGTLASLSIQFNNHPVDNQPIRITSNVAITSLTCVPNSGQTIDACPTSMGAHTTQSWLYYNASAEFIKQ